MVMGGMFSGMVSSFVSDILLPPVGLLIGSNFDNWFWVLVQGETKGQKYHTIREAQEDGAVTMMVMAMTMIVRMRRMRT